MTRAVRHISDTCIELSAPDAKTAQFWAEQMRETALCVEVVAGMDSLSLCFDPRTQNADDVLAAADRLKFPRASTSDMSPLLTLPISFAGEDAPDIDLVCETLNLVQDTVIERFLQQNFTIEMIGFTPGFAYLSGLDPSLCVPRHTQPRARIRAGSVGIAAGKCGLYALAGPGGWPIIGRTDVALFDATRPDPFRLKPGQKIVFERVGVADV